MSFPHFTRSPASAWRKYRPTEIAKADLWSLLTCDLYVSGWPNKEAIECTNNTLKNQVEPENAFSGKEKFHYQIIKITTHWVNQTLKTRPRHFLPIRQPILGSGPWCRFRPKIIHFSHWLVGWFVSYLSRSPLWFWPQIFQWVLPWKLCPKFPRTRDGGCVLNFWPSAVLPRTSWRLKNRGKNFTGSQVKNSSPEIEVVFFTRPFWFWGEGKNIRTSWWFQPIWKILQ